MNGRAISPARGAALVLFALAAAGCTPSLWAHRRSFEAGGAGARLLVPRLWAPLLPGSIYPDKKKPIEAEARPFVVVLARPEARMRRDDLVTTLGERGAVVLVLEGRAPAASVRTAAEALRAAPECRGARFGLLLAAPTAEDVGLLRRDALDAPIAILLPPAPPKAAAATGPVALFLLRGAGGPSSSLSAAWAAALGAPAVERWFEPWRGAFPREAFRDAGEWLAGELGLR